MFFTDLGLEFLKEKTNELLRTQQPSATMNTARVRPRTCREDKYQHGSRYAIGNEDNNKNENENENEDKNENKDKNKNEDKNDYDDYIYNRRRNASQDKHALGRRKIKIDDENKRKIYENKKSENNFCPLISSPGTETLERVCTELNTHIRKEKRASVVADNIEKSKLLHFMRLDSYIIQKGIFS